MKYSVFTCEKLILWQPRAAWEFGKQWFILVNQSDRKYFALPIFAMIFLEVHCLTMLLVKHIPGSTSVTLASRIWKAGQLIFCHFWDYPHYKSSGFWEDAEFIETWGTRDVDFHVGNGFFQPLEIIHLLEWLWNELVLKLEKRLLILSSSPQVLNSPAQLL